MSLGGHVCPRGGHVCPPRPVMPAPWWLKDESGSAKPWCIVNAAFHRPNCSQSGMRFAPISHQSIGIGCLKLADGAFDEQHGEGGTYDMGIEMSPLYNLVLTQAVGTSQCIEYGLCLG